MKTMGSNKDMSKGMIVKIYKKKMFQHSTKLTKIKIKMRQKKIYMYMYRKMIIKTRLINLRQAGRRALR